MSSAASHAEQRQHQLESGCEPTCMTRDTTPSEEPSISSEQEDTHQPKQRRLGNTPNVARWCILRQGAMRVPATIRSRWRPVFLINRRTTTKMALTVVPVRPAFLSPSHFVSPYRRDATRTPDIYTRSPKKGAEPLADELNSFVQSEGDEMAGDAISNFAHRRRPFSPKASGPPVSKRSKCSCITFACDDKALVHMQDCSGYLETLLQGTLSSANECHAFLCSGLQQQRENVYSANYNRRAMDSGLLTHQMEVTLVAWLWSVLLCCRRRIWVANRTEPVVSASDPGNFVQ